jgi:pyridoxine/pyridoxamine 5'-phosphate oxidase
MDTYAEAGCGWSRVHVNHVLSSVVATLQGTFAAWAAGEGEARSAARYYALSTAKAAADLEARCQYCRCAPWVSGQSRTVDDRRRF